MFQPAISCRAESLADAALLRITQNDDYTDRGLLLRMSLLFRAILKVH
jgi:hypothetical protein